MRAFEEMTLAARRAGAEDFIDHLPRGYETMLHEGAPALSAGQRQRLALARALITTPKVLILDEALNALDAEIEASVESHLREARRGLTTIIVSHRLAALMACDMIMVMADGEVRDIGSHAELLERSDLYGRRLDPSAGCDRGRGAVGWAAGPVLTGRDVGFEPFEVSLGLAVRAAARFVGLASFDGAAVDPSVLAAPDIP